ncbi:hypothetical protein K7X08_038123 [Anisodus acutangulus]|uniref:Uncharacterized protein n=1 Tax=Anisodus acutangulus TaxID=402998 RepID=A0A9Q1RSN9_9SOLA|nr:hypothetical protein K7X08_038123 [Anisodus acutangulus]
MNKGKSQQSKEGKDKENIKKSSNASEQNKVANNKAVSTNKFDVLSIVNEEGGKGVSNINIEVIVDKEFIIDGIYTSSKEDYIILSTENSITEEAKIGDGVEVNTVAYITVSPIEEALRTDYYPHSNGDGEVVQIPSITKALVMKEIIHDMFVLKKSSPNKELHYLVSHDMNRLDTGSKEDVVHKGNCPSLDMKLSEEEDVRQHLSDFSKEADITS